MNKENWVEIETTKLGKNERNWKRDCLVGNGRQKRIGMKSSNQRKGDVKLYLGNHGSGKIRKIGREDQEENKKGRKSKETCRNTGKGRATDAKLE